MVSGVVAVNLAHVADLWEENQEFLKQSLGQSGYTRFGAHWVLMPHVPLPKFNHVSKVRVDAAAVPELIGEARTFFRRQGLPNCCIMTTPATQPKDLPERLHHLGFTCETNPVMVWDGRPIEVRNAQLRIEEAPRDRAAQVFQLIRHVFFPDSSEPAVFYLRGGVEVSYDIGSLNYIAFLGETPVGVGSLFCRGEMGGIYNMGTLPQYRGLGVATAILAACLEDASRLGCTHIGLTPTPMGRPLYESLGFHEVYQERYFSERFQP